MKNCATVFWRGGVQAVARPFYERDVKSKVLLCLAADAFSWQRAPNGRSRELRCRQVRLTNAGLSRASSHLIKPILLSPSPSGHTIDRFRSVFSYPGCSFKWQPWFYPRLVAYSYFRLSEGAYSEGRSLANTIAPGAVGRLILSLVPRVERPARVPLSLQLSMTSGWCDRQSACEDPGILYKFLAVCPEDRATLESDPSAAAGGYTNRGGGLGPPSSALFGTPVGDKLTSH